jgi:hypothetical protein
MEKKFEIVFKVNAISEKSIFSAVLNKSARSTDNIAVVHNDPKYRDNVESGHIINFSKNTDAAAHEYGHTLGLDDQYFDVYTYKYRFGSSSKADDYILSSKNISE